MSADAVQWGAASELVATDLELAAVRITSVGLWRRCDNVAVSQLGSMLLQALMRQFYDIAEEPGVRIYGIIVKIYDSGDFGREVPTQ